MRTFTACFGTEEPLQTCGPELKTKLHDPFEPFSTSYHVLVVNRVSEVLSKKQHYLYKKNTIFSEISNPIGCFSVNA